MGTKRKASEMNGSNASDYDEPDFKAKKTNENRRRSSFIRGKFSLSKRKGPQRTVLS